MLILEAHKREKFGKKLKKARKEGLLPAVLYGEDTRESQALFLQIPPFLKILKEAGESTIITLKVQNGETREFPVLIYDVQRDPLTSNPIHVDFYRASLKKEIKTSVPLRFEGQPSAVNLGGTLVKNVQEIKVRALPMKLPREIVVDVMPLQTFEDVLRIKDIILPDGVSFVEEDHERIVAQVVPFKEEKVKEELARPFEEAVKPEEIEVVKKEKAKAKEEEVEEAA